MVYSCQSSAKKEFKIKMEDSFCEINIITYKFNGIPPFYIDTQKEKSFLYPDKHGYLRIKKCAEIVMSCDGEWSNFPKAPDTISAMCIEKDIFSYEGESHRLNQFTCKKWPKITALNKNETCYRGEGILIEVGYYLIVPPKTLFPVYTSCHTPRICDNFYVSYIIAPIPYQKNVARPNFITGGYFQNCNITNAYMIKNQITTVGKTLKSRDQALKYIDSDMTKNFYLARGTQFFRCLKYFLNLLKLE